MQSRNSSIKQKESFDDDVSLQELEAFDDNEAVEVEALIENAIPEATSKSMNQQKHKYIVSVLACFSVGLGVITGYQPKGQGWRLFSWHPLLMTLGFVGLMGTAAVTKKLGGYTNTKVHGLLASGGLLLALGGFYAIYKNKAINNKSHFTSWHSWFGLITLLGSVLPMLVGIVFLHPDFGIDKKNELKRKLHKWFARAIIIVAWMNCILGLTKLTDDRFIQIIYAFPLICLMPFALY